MNSKLSAPLTAVLTLAVLLAGCSEARDAAEPAPAGAPAPSAATAGQPFNLLSGTAKTNNAAPGTGDWSLMTGSAPVKTQTEVAERWVQLTATDVGDLGRGVVNGAKLTLYRFDKDSTNRAKSVCNDDCAQAWPPVTVSKTGKVFIAGVKKSDIGFVKRDDGRLQVTIRRSPVYRFAEDTKPGDIKGQGVGGTWFAVTRTGGKLTGGNAGQPDVSEQPDTGNQPDVGEQSGGAVAAATSAFLFSEPNFSDTAATQGVTGGDCRDVSLNVRSISADGRFFVWDKPGCQGNRREFDDEGVADLGDFDTNSIRLR